MKPLVTRCVFEHASSQDLSGFECSDVHYCDVQEQKNVHPGHEEGEKERYYMTLE
jgi:hypothetical protein